ncbi:zinc finger E-box-binding homeobox 2 isoform X2 [Denticeps clupeoides]|uniref:C2H2-type domain-containing protein n=1 Tax=Denticeps clupeoides TaxID=299321 RepID=A0AAY4AXJ7_9TELE|nr:zinc finger E-box-binding homeobox 2-like isoform X2 [Denticeps clupeoides]
MEAQDAPELQDKTSLTPSEGTEPGSPAHFPRPQSLSPGEGRWAEGDAPAVISTPEDGHRSSQSYNGAPLSPTAIEPMLACPYCCRTYRNKASLREHTKFCHEREAGTSICGYAASYRTQMERQLALHNQAQDKLVSDQSMENRKFKCTQCGKAFKYKHHLKEHVRIHSGEKPYECSNCKKRFSHSGSYSSHLSSKKCLNGSGGVGGSFNGHANPTYILSSHTSPPVAGARNAGKCFPYTTSGLDCHPVQSPTDHALSQDPGVATLRGPDLSRLWDPTAEVSLRASVFKGTTILPYLQSGGKFEHLLQQMLRREVQQEDVESTLREEEKGGRETRGSAEKGRLTVAGVTVGVTCRWCSQLFPNAAVLLQHERYLCKMNKDTEVTEVPQAKESSPLNFSRPSPSAQDPPKTPTNGFSRDRSPLQGTPWHSVPQQLLVALQSPMHLHSDAMTSRPYWPNRELGSPGSGTPVSPSSLELPVTPLQQRRRVPSSGFGSPLCLDLTAIASPHNRPTPPCRTPGSASSQSEPLDLSLPKPKTEQFERVCNGMPQAEGPHRRLSPPHQLVTATGYQPSTAFPGVPMFGGSIYGTYPLLSPMIPAGLRGTGHEGVPSLPNKRTAHDTGFLSPMAYMLESDAESVLKRIHQERQTRMSEAISMGLDYLSVMEEGLEGDPGRKRLKKTEEGLYACDICDKTFQKSSSLLRHKYEHTGKRPHECKICKKAFKHKHHLIEHSRLHSGEKPYQCDKCGKRFSHSGSYSQHMNHRYAYCSRDVDLDGPGEDAHLGEESQYHAPSLHLNARSTPMRPLEDNPTFLSDSSLDGAPGGTKEDEDDEEEDESALKHRAPMQGNVGILSPGNELGEGSLLKDIERRCAETDEEENHNHCDETKEGQSEKDPDNYEEGPNATNDEQE